ncbi:FAD-dependent oxidoreductase [Micromonospora sp. NPDC000121]|uniref:FAD-dependent oxidoreductase n=1 Tax=Micromonospora sp. NPDC000121 TaxID=3364214 RepID=UPI0036A9BD59
MSPDERKRLTARGIRIVEGTVTRLVIDRDRLAGVELDRGSVVAPAAIFVRPRFVASNGLLTGLGCQVDGNGWVVVNQRGRTSVPGVWAAGNAVDPRAQVITAAGAGSAAAIALHADLVEQDVQRAIADARPFSAALERQVTEAVLADRRHGL